MEYSLELEIDVPCSFLIELMEDPANLSSWQPEVTEYSLLSGEQGQVGSEMKLTYDLNGRTVDLVQTVTVRDPPNELTSRFETSGMVSVVTNRFAEIGFESTFWRLESKYEFTNLLFKLLGYFLPHLFSAQTQRYMNLLKQFAESEYRRETHDS